MSLKSGVNGVLDNLLLYLVADNEPEQYTVAFSALAGWVDNSLDLYQVRTWMHASLTAPSCTIYASR